MATEHDDARYQYWVDIERENAAEIDEFYRRIVWGGNPPDDDEEDEDDDPFHPPGRELDDDDVPF
jgi:hypothetical protein